MGTVRTIKIEESVFADNTSSAEAIRRMLTDKKTTMINIMSSPGSGKTTLLTALVNKLKDELTIRVMDVDIESTLCHLDAEMTRQGLDGLSLRDIDLVILENVGNLVCPAEFDTGAHRNVMILSVPEGDDKPLKYPLMFSVSDLVLINKIDTMDFFDFDIDAAKKRILRLNPNAEILPVSAKTGEGVDAVCDWVRSVVKMNGRRQ